jgi:hypothetical protein
MPIEQGKSNNRFRLAISSRSFTVKIMKPGTVSLALMLIVSLAARSVLAQPPPREHQAPLDEALEVYQGYSGKTVLRSPNLPPLAEFNKPIPSSDTNGMRVVLENDLLNKGIELIPLRDDIVLAVESGWKNSPTANYIGTIKPRPARVSISSSKVSAAEESIPPGTIDFRGAHISQFLDLYAMLLNRSLLRPSQIASSTFKLHTQTPFTRNAVIYLLEVSLALNGIASVDDGTNFVQIAPLQQASNLKLRAPQPDRTEPVIYRDGIRQFGGGEFMPGKKLKPSPTSADDVVAYYAELTGRSAVPSERAGRQFVPFKAQTALTKPELLYALETSLALNGLAIIEIDDKTIRAGYGHERTQSAKNSR